MFNHKPIFCDIVFCFGEFFIGTDSSFTSTAVEFTVCRSFECPPSPNG